MGTCKVNSSRKTVLQRERGSKINVTMPAGHTLPLTFAFDFTASYFRISSVVPEPVIFKRFRLWFRLQPSGSTGSGTCSSSASLPLTTPLFSAFRTAIHSFVTGEPRDFIFGTLTYHSTSHPAEEKSSLKGAWSGSNNLF